MPWRTRRRLHGIDPGDRNHIVSDGVVNCVVSHGDVNRFAMEDFARDGEQTVWGIQPKLRSDDLNLIVLFDMAREPQWRQLNGGMQKTLCRIDFFSKNLYCTVLEPQNRLFVMFDS